MARLRFTRHAPLLHAGSVTVTNGCSCPVSVNLTVKLETGSEANYFTQTVHVKTYLIQDGSTITVPLEDTRDPNDVTGWFLETSHCGVLWRVDAQPTPRTGYTAMSQVAAVPSGAYHLINDPENPPYSADEFGTVELTLLEALQQVAPYERLWNTVSGLLPETVLRNRTPEQLGEHYESYASNRTLLLPFWQVRYPLVQLKLQPTNTIDDWVPNLERDLTTGGSARVDVYWRCLDRRMEPEGVYDTSYNYCYSYNCRTRDASLRVATTSEGSLFRTEYRTRESTVQGSSNNSNTSSSRGRRTRGRRVSSNTRSAEPNGDAVEKLLGAVRDLGLGDFECAVRNSVDGNEENANDGDGNVDAVAQNPQGYDSTWTSTEIVAFLPKPWSPSTSAKSLSTTLRQSVLQLMLINQRQKDVQLPIAVLHRIAQFLAPPAYVPILRLHKRHVIEKWVGPSPHFPAPSSAQTKVLDRLQEMIGGLRRVHTWTEGGALALPPIRDSEELDAVCDYWDLVDQPDDTLPYHQALLPIYFDFPARCCVTNENS